MYFLRYFKHLRFHRTYITYAFASGLSTLVIPLGTQYLVNQLSLAGIWANTLSFLLIIGTIICLAQVFRHGQIVLVEYLQRQIFVSELRRWRHLRNPDNSHYYFEIFTLLKSFAKTYTDIIDMFLVILFGMTTVMIFHPAFLVLPLLTGLTIYMFHRNFKGAFATSIEESNRKYDIYDHLQANNTDMAGPTFSYLRDRDLHFKYIRKMSVMISVLFSFSIIYVLAAGTYLIELEQLSVGQLVAAELIISGIMVSLAKLPNSLESLYDFETSHYKIEKALRAR